MAVSLTALSPARATGTTDEASEHAVKLGYEGDELYARSRWTEAYERFAAADALRHSPVFVLYMARCRKNAGHFAEARVLYARVVGERFGPDAPKPFQTAVSEAADEQRELVQRTPAVLLVVTGASGAIVRVDGRGVADYRGPIPLDPGPHGIEASSGARSVRRDVDLHEGAGTVRVELSMAEPSPAAPRSAGPAVAALSLGVVGLGVGATTGLMAISEAGGFRQACVGGHCPVADASRLDSARTLATISTVGFVVAGAGLAGAIIFFAARRTNDARTRTVGVFLGPSRAGLEGTF
jgi:hypothetical protein